MRTKLLLLGILLSSALFAQSYTLKGHVYDESDQSEALIGANVMYSSTSGTVADIEGFYELKLEAGEYTIKFSYVGYTPISKTINVTGNMTLDMALSSTVMMSELTVVADVAIARETPVAFSTLTPKTLEENLASQDIPMALNSTPGVYATQEGGGEGDAQVTIRGFSSRNVGVLLDGVPVNDMENGAVYWSNWFGLDAVTRSMQVQRGLGASKLALPSIGGTINIMTKGMENKRGGQFKQEVGSDGMLRSTFGYNTGALKNGWGFSVAGSYKQGDGYADQTSYKGFFWYGKIDKKLGNHTLSLSAYGAPQEHAQRSYKLPVAVYDSAYAEENGVRLSYSADMTEDDRKEVDNNRLRADEGIDRGVRYNQHWGYLARTKDDPNAEAKPLNERLNQYHKPQITLKDSWHINDKLFMSNILYASIGNGGGVRAASSSWLTPDDEGLIDFQTQYDANTTPNPFMNEVEGDIGTSNGYLRRLVNSHRWLGFLSTFNFEQGNFTHSGGIDIRRYKGIHYQEIYDMLGADYVSVNSDQVMPNASQKLHEGDITSFHNDGLVNWEGLFYQLEYKNNDIATFLNITRAYTGYKRVDYFAGLKQGAESVESDWYYFPGATIKGGANYNFSETMNVFANLGYLNKAPRFSNVFDYDNKLFRDIKNEKVSAFELGYSYHSGIFSGNINSYYTLWNDRPVDNAVSVNIDGEDYSANIQGMDAIHKGVELDFVIEATDELSFQGLLSLGDWRWNSADSVRLYDDNQNLKTTRYFDAKGVHVGNSAQTQIAGEIRWEPIKSLYFKPRVTYFTRYYAEFDPMSLDPVNSPDSFNEDGSPRDSWQVPSYALFDLHMGYSRKVYDYLVSFRFNILNVLDKTYVASATNNDSYNGYTFNDFDAKSASVFMGLGRRYNMSLTVKF